MPAAGNDVSWDETKRDRSRADRKTLRQTRLSSRPWTLRTIVRSRTGWASLFGELNLSMQIHEE